MPDAGTYLVVFSAGSEQLVSSTLSLFFFYFLNLINCFLFHALHKFLSLSQCARYRCDFQVEQASRGRLTQGDRAYSQLFISFFFFFHFFCVSDPQSEEGQRVDAESSIEANVSPDYV